MTTIDAIFSRLQLLSDEKTAGTLRWFFKTGPGEYGEGDLFRGIRVPVLRKLCREFFSASVDDAVKLLASSWHEDRLLGLLLLVERYKKPDEALRTCIYTRYCACTDRINNWDLVDISCPGIVGRHLQDRDRSQLYRFAASESLWERRIAIVSTFQFIRAGHFDDTLAIAEKLIGDRQDLIHKATGWMLREVGKRDVETLEGFLAEYYCRMPRTMLRYAIEKLPEPRRQAWLKGTI
ncbi:MAG: DNA alkylation repair protein [Chlorobium sp.]|jgi:3-methyladenine DNA glycosylase AlkD|uniref:DNA alkylation repair protein n=1 Tax=Chlorobium sp. TaxID=1095 RepID=UPI001D83CBA3|nr:DNA alkylation repair protein [Chlorobium sp.]MBN1279008.1 DNA alkylation repair protein [Chlorobiaceae bacterium]MCF8215738.1 DNA alkylation repair protein [Chlorobium sp.]MCF8270528.1 DNA alkylation repair protein [Chlorobium sp.]MCF8286948.1 DNA alkylation repair protein [Chlorobium sp.]MCF8290544.1 DNA alkylation repair protein [Chlorobium sp.]